MTEETPRIRFKVKLVPNEAREKARWRKYVADNPEAPMRGLEFLGYWVTDALGDRVWVGPVSGVEWRKRHGWKEGPKPAPSYIWCEPFDQWKGLGVCTQMPYPQCADCKVPKQIKFRARLKKVCAEKKPEDQLIPAWRVTLKRKKVG